MASKSDQKGLYCKYCGKKTLHESDLFLGGCFLTVLTAGLFLPIWILLQTFGSHWRCQTCGSKRSGRGKRPFGSKNQTTSKSNTTAARYSKLNLDGQRGKTVTNYTEQLRSKSARDKKLQKWIVILGIFFAVGIPAAILQHIIEEPKRQQERAERAAQKEQDEQEKRLAKADYQRWVTELQAFLRNERDAPPEHNDEYLTRYCKSEVDRESGEVSRHRDFSMRLNNEWNLAWMRKKNNICDRCGWDSWRK